MEREVRQPGETGTMAFNLVQQHRRAVYPFECVQTDNRASDNGRDQKARDKSHIVIERQPACYHITARDADRTRIKPRLLQKLSMRQHDSFLVTGGARTVLQ